MTLRFVGDSFDAAVGLYLYRCTCPVGVADPAKQQHYRSLLDSHSVDIAYETLGVDWRWHHQTRSHLVRELLMTYKINVEETEAQTRVSDDLVERVERKSCAIRLLAASTSQFNSNEFSAFL